MNAVYVEILINQFRRQGKCGLGQNDVTGRERREFLQLFSNPFRKKAASMQTEGDIGSEFYGSPFQLGDRKSQMEELIQA